MPVREVKLWDSEIVYTIGALMSALEQTDQFRLETIAKGLGKCNDVTELSLTEKYTAMISLRAALTGNWTHLDASIDKIRARLWSSSQEHPWISANWRSVEGYLTPE